MTTSVSSAVADKNFWFVLRHESGSSRSNPHLRMVDQALLRGHAHVSLGDTSRGLPISRHINPARENLLRRFAHRAGRVRAFCLAQRHRNHAPAQMATPCAVILCPGAGEVDSKFIGLPRRRGRLPSRTDRRWNRIRRRRRGVSCLAPCRI